MTDVIWRLQTAGRLVRASRLSHKAVEDDPSKIRYAIVVGRNNQDPKTRIVRVSWDPDERVVVFWDADWRRAARVTLEILVGERLELREQATSNKKALPCYRAYWLRELFLSDSQLTDEDAQKLLEYCTQ